MRQSKVPISSSSLLATVLFAKSISHGRLFQRPLPTAATNPEFGERLRLARRRRKLDGSVR
jgi:hypothetical protein